MDEFTKDKLNQLFSEYRYDNLLEFASFICDIRAGVPQITDRILFWFLITPSMGSALVGAH